MSKRLEEMTLEELWQLFPIELKPHDPRWKEFAAEEISFLQALLAEFHPVISHIGSTAIPGIMAKPIVDILVELPTGADTSALRRLMEDRGYICMSSSPGRMSFNKGYTPEGYAERVFHIHFHRAGDRNEVIFRDYLLARPEAAREYERLKQSLLPALRNNRDAYTDAKSDFVKKILALAGKE